MNRNIGSTDSVDTNQKQQRRPLAVPRSPYPGRSARRSGVSQKDKIESKFSLTRPTPLEISSLESVLTPNPPASPLDSAFTKNNRGWRHMGQAFLPVLPQAGSINTRDHSRTIHRCERECL